jgi:hypothetical protein
MAEPQNELLSQIERLISSKLEDFQQSQKDFSQAQISKLQESLKNNATDSYTFRKKGNEEQSKVNSHVLEKLQEAGGFLRDVVRPCEALVSAQEKIAEGIDLLQHRQKMIKLADSSDSGWRVVKEYEAHPLADDEEDEKKIYRAQFKADKKLRQERRQRSFRFSPYGRRSFIPETSSTSQSETPTWNQSSQGRKPGTCFRCGRPGHWRTDCRAAINDGNSLANREVQTKSQISKMSLLEKSDAKCDNNDDVCASLISPVDRLKSCSNHWKEAGASQYIMDVVEQGYKLPFKKLPESIFLKNNKSARESPSFVTNEINSLISKGCITEVHDMPYIVNPLTVAYSKSGKQRLVLDCRLINLELFKFNMRFEDHSLVKNMFGRGDYLFSFDIRSAYHHVMIFPDHRTYLGFSWENNGKIHFYVFNVLPFGISTAGFIFTKLLRVAVKKWRSLGYRVVLFLDDGIGGDSTYCSAMKMSDFVHDDLGRFGFIIAEDKCNWLPRQRIVWLGYLWDTLNSIFRVTDERIQKTLKLLQNLVEQISEGKLIFPVRTVASLIGQLISMQSAIGPVVRLRSRSLYECVASRASWEAPIMINSRALDELLFWKENLIKLNKGCLQKAVDTEIKSTDKQKIVFCDASGAGFAGFIEGDDDSHVTGCWSEQESSLSSTWRELETVNRVLNTSLNSLEGQSVIVKTDNKNVVSILKTGSRKQYLQDISIGVHQVCSRHNIDLVPQWVPRADNQEADFFSRCTDSDDWSIASHVFEQLNTKWGPHTFDLFACSYNTKCRSFFSKYWCPGTAGINALNFKWVNENYWLVPPPRLVVQCIQKVLTDNCSCTLIVPVWRSAPYWPVLFTDGKTLNSNVSDHYIFSPGKLTERGRGRNGIFDGRPLTFGLIAVRFN